MCIKALLPRHGYRHHMPSPQLLPATVPAALLLSDSVTTADASIVSRQILREADARVTLFSFAPGQELTPHTNARRALVHILSGTAEFFYADAWHTLPAGSLLHLPPNAPHAARATEFFTMLLTLCGEPQV